MLVLGFKTLTAKHQHLCESCLGTIEPGQTYVRARVVDGREAWTWKAHEYCQTAGIILFEDGREGDDGTLLRVCDFDQDDVDFIKERAPEIAIKIWDQK